MQSAAMEGTKKHRAANRAVFSFDCFVPEEQGEQLTRQLCFRELSWPEQ
jgi:hypothetical protein